jgi:hypothetical protein
MGGKRRVKILPSGLRVEPGAQRHVRVAPESVHIWRMNINIPLRCINICSRLKDLRRGIRMKLKRRGLTRSMLYHILKGIVLHRTWDMTAFVVFADFIDEIYNVVSDICRLCKIRKTALLQYLAGFIGESDVQQRIAKAGLGNGSILY